MSQLLRFRFGLSGPVGVLALALCGTACLDEPTGAPDESVVDSEEIIATTLVPRNTKFNEATYIAQTRNWIHWAMGQPWSTGPIGDTTGARCADNQAGPVWYLAGTGGGSVTRECTIPAGKRLFFPLINTFFIRRPDRVDTPEERAAFVAFAEQNLPLARADTCGLTLKLDGHVLSAGPGTLDEETWVQITDPFTVVFNNDNFFGGPGGPWVTVVGGHHALLNPLLPGEHFLELGGKICENGTVVFETAAQYYLNVLP